MDVGATVESSMGKTDSTWVLCCNLGPPGFSRLKRRGGENGYEGNEDF